MKQIELDEKVLDLIDNFLNGEKVNFAQSEMLKKFGLKPITYDEKNFEIDIKNNILGISEDNMIKHFFPLIQNIIIINLF